MRRCCLTALRGSRSPRCGSSAATWFRASSRRGVRPATGLSQPPPHNDAHSRTNARCAPLLAPPVVHVGVLKKALGSRVWARHASSGPLQRLTSRMWRRRVAARRRMMTSHTAPPTPVAPQTDKEKALAEEEATSLKTILRALGGNAFITLSKFAAFFYSGSSAMLSEAIHTLVDTGNQALLLIGFRQSRRSPDKLHAHGYGRAAFFYSLISAMGMFWVGAGVTIWHGVGYLLQHTHEPVTYGLLTWSVLGISFIIDGGVLLGAVRDVNAQRKEGVSFIQHMRTMKDPFMLTVMLEDFAATAGILLAIGGIGMTSITGNPVWDGIASVAVGGLLGGVAMALIQMNKSYLLGRSVDPETEASIRRLLDSRASVEGCYGVVTQWEGPSSFAYKVEIDFDGKFFARRLAPLYEERFRALACSDFGGDDASAQGVDVKRVRSKKLSALLGEYTEDVTRFIEHEVFLIQKSIRAEHPDASFIKVQPRSMANADLEGKDGVSRSSLLEFLRANTDMDVDTDSDMNVSSSAEKSPQSQDSSEPRSHDDNDDDDAAAGAAKAKKDV